MYYSSFIIDICVDLESIIDIDIFKFLVHFNQISLEYFFGFSEWVGDVITWHFFDEISIKIQIFEIIIAECKYLFLILFFYLSEVSYVFFLHALNLLF